MVRRLRDVLLLTEFPDRLPAVHFPQCTDLLLRRVSLSLHRLVPFFVAQTLTPSGSVWRGHVSPVNRHYWHLIFW